MIYDNLIKYIRFVLVLLVAFALLVLREIGTVVVGQAVRRVPA
jgi:hypothetical protein